MAIPNNNLNGFLKKKLVTEDSMNNNNTNINDLAKFDNYNENAIHKVIMV